MRLISIQVDDQLFHQPVGNNESRGRNRQGNFPSKKSKRNKKRKKKKEEEKAAEEKGKTKERVRQASRRSPFVARLANLEEGRCQ